MVRGTNKEIILNESDSMATIGAAVLAFSTFRQIIAAQEQGRAEVFIPVRHPGKLRLLKAVTSENGFDLEVAAPGLVRIHWEAA